LFQVSQSALSAATADILSAHTTSFQAAETLVPAQTLQAAVTSPTIAPAVSAITTVEGQTKDGQTTSNTTAPTPAPAPAPAPVGIANAGIAATVTTQGQQSLNVVLLALGLSNSDIQKIDLIAASINNFNPSLFTDLVQQFQAQAQQTAANAEPSQPATSAKTATA
jgi:hypothetical protein